LEDGRYAQFLALVVDDEDFAHADLFVYAEISGYRSPLISKRALPEAPRNGALL
jgi:hypothetical protein